MYDAIFDYVEMVDNDQTRISSIEFEFDKPYAIMIYFEIIVLYVNIRYKMLHYY